MADEKIKGKIVTVETFNEPILANIMKTKLEAYGVECFLADENIVTVNPLVTQAVGGIKLKVREEDLEKAQAIVNEAVFPEKSETDEGTHCPYCGSTNTTVILGHSNVFVAMWWLFLSSLPFYSKRHYYCHSCKKYFKKKREE